MTRKKKRNATQPRRKVEDKLDRALEDTFPASDPVSLIEPAPSDDDDKEQSDKNKPPARG